MRRKVGDRGRNRERIDDRTGSVSAMVAIALSPM
jgi:hypothetical protein